MNDILLTFGLSLSLTLVLELAVSPFFHFKKRDYLLLLLVNILTNPAAVYLHLVCQSLIGGNIYLWQIPIELLVMLTEGLVYSKCSSIRRPWLFAVCANVFSYGAGLLLNIII